MSIYTVSKKQHDRSVALTVACYCDFSIFVDDTNPAEKQNVYEKMEVENRAKCCSAYQMLQAPDTSKISYESVSGLLSNHGQSSSMAADFRMCS